MRKNKSVHPPTSSAEAERRVELYLLPLWFFVTSSRMNTTFTFNTVYMLNSERQAQRNAPQLLNVTKCDLT